MHAAIHLSSVKSAEILIDRLQHVRNPPNDPDGCLPYIKVQFRQRTGLNVNDDLDPCYEKLSPHEVHCARQRLARAHAALFPTLMALSRWSSGARPLPHHDQFRLRAAWFARVGGDHQDWLERGGFAQHDDLPPLRQPTMWHPPRLLSPGAPQADNSVPDHCNDNELHHPSRRTARDDDAASAAA
jgi:hypothetical protein